MGPQDSNYVDINNVVNSTCKHISKLSNNTLEDILQFCCFVFTMVQQSYTLAANKNSLEYPQGLYYRRPFLIFSLLNDFIMQTYYLLNSLIAKSYKIAYTGKCNN